MRPCLPASGTSHLMSAMRKGKQAHSGPSREAGKTAPTVHATNRCQSACCAKPPSKLQMLLMPYPKSHMRGHDSCNDVFETPVQMRKDSEARLIFTEHPSLTENRLFSSTFAQISLSRVSDYLPSEPDTAEACLQCSLRLTTHFQPLLSLPLPTIISMPPGPPTTSHLGLQDQHPIPSLPAQSHSSFPSDISSEQ